MRTYRVAFAALFAGLLGTVSNAAAPDAWLDSPIEADNEATPGYELFDLCRSLNKPCGQEQTRSRELRQGKGPKFSLKKSSARKALDKITQRYPSHRWIQRDGVLILEPKKRAGEDVLARKLERVSIHDTLSLKAANDVLRQAKIPGIGISMTGDPRYACIDLELTNVTVREALNAIVKADGQAAWSFVPTEKGDHGPSMQVFSWRKTGGVGLAHPTLGFIYSGEAETKRGCRELEKYFKAP